MAFSELELRAIDHIVGGFCRRITRPASADELRFVYEIDGQAVSIYEERPPWDGRGDWTRMGVARFRYVRSRKLWKLYWMRRDLRWHAYDPDGVEQTADLESLVAIVEEDRYCAFFG